MSDHQDKIPLQRVSVGLRVNKDNQAALGHVTGVVKFISIYLFPDSLVLEPSLTYQVAPVFLCPFFSLLPQPCSPPPSFSPAHSGIIILSYLVSPTASFVKSFLCTFPLSDTASSMFRLRAFHILECPLCTTTGGTTVTRIKSLLRWSFQSSGLG